MPSGYLPTSVGRIAHSSGGDCRSGGAPQECERYRTWNRRVAQPSVCMSLVARVLLKMRAIRGWWRRTPVSSNTLEIG